MSLLTNALEKIMYWLEKNKPQSVNSFLPGLSLYEIHSGEEKIGYALPEEIYKLYQWRNGTTEDCWSLFFPSIGFLPFDRAVTISQGWNSIIFGREEELREEEWYVKAPLFIFQMENSDCCAVPLQLKGDNKQMPVVCLGEGEMPGIYYTNLTNMMLTLAECCETDAYYLGTDGYIRENQSKSTLIFRKYNSELVVETIDTLQSLLLQQENFPSGDICDRAIRAIIDMGRFQDPKGIEILIEAFQMWEIKNNLYRDSVCWSIVNSLGKIDDRKVLETLNRALYDRSELVREEAKKALI